MERAKKKANTRGRHAGVVFTPPELARRLAAALPTPGAGPVRLLDPACGDGALLAAALERAGESATYATENLFGIELDPELAERARRRLRAAGGLPPGTPLDGHIVTGDALDSGARWPEGTWILANPPWLSLSGRHAAHDRKGRRRARAGGWPALHSAFLERIAEHVAREGTGAALLLPAATTELDGYGPVRAAVTAWTDLVDAPVELGERAFDGVTEPAVMITLIARADAGAGSARAWRSMPADRAALLTRLERHPRLPAKSFADPGVHTGNSARQLVVARDEPGAAPVYQGRDLHAFQLGEPSAGLRTDLRPSPERRFQIGTLDRYRAFPVLLRQTANRPIAALHERPSYFRNSLLACRPVAGLDPAFVVAVLNGPVASAWHRLMFRDSRQRAFPQVKVNHLASQPFPIATRADNPALHDELAARARTVAAGDRAAAGELAERTLAAFALDAGERELVRSLAE